MRTASEAVKQADTAASAEAVEPKVIHSGQATYSDSFCWLFVKDHRFALSPIFDWGEYCSLFVLPNSFLIFLRAVLKDLF